MKTKPFILTEANAVLIIVLLLSTFTFSHCSDNGKENQRKDLDNFNTYVSEHRTASEKYYDQKWEDMDREYNERKTLLEKDIEKMDNESKEIYNKSVADWEAYKNEFNAKQEERKQLTEVNNFKMKLLPSGTDTELKSLTAHNIQLVYVHFYDIVEKNKDTYTKEEWNHINNLWVNMNYMREGFEKNHEIPEAEMKKINNVRLKYTAIKALNRPFADSEHDESDHKHSDHNDSDHKHSDHK